MVRVNDGRLTGRCCCYSGTGFTETYTTCCDTRTVACIWDTPAI